MSVKLENEKKMLWDFLFCLFFVTASNVVKQPGMRSVTYVWPKNSNHSRSWRLVGILLVKLFLEELILEDISEVLTKSKVYPTRERQSWDSEKGVETE